MELLADLLDRIPGYETNRLSELFPSSTPRALRSLNAEVERAHLLLDIQDTVRGRFEDIAFTPRHTVGFRHRSHTYVAAHYDWGGSLEAAMLVSAAAREFAAVSGLAIATTSIASLLGNDGLSRAEALEAWLLLRDNMVTTADNVLTGGIHNTCFRNTGYTYANVIDAFDVPDTGDDNRPIDLDNPSLLFFDGQSNLTGCGYIRPLTSSTDPDIFAPELGPIRSEWFAHPSGRHTDDGGFESHAGHDHSHGGPRHHGASWDIHIWFNLERTTIEVANAQLTRTSVAGIPVVGHTTDGSRIAAPPNVARGSSTDVVDLLVCSNGEPSFGFYRTPESLL